jgi:hypothetical protein
MSVKIFLKSSLSAARTGRATYLRKTLTDSVLIPLYTTIYVSNASCMDWSMGVLGCVYACVVARMYVEDEDVLHVHFTIFSAGR